MSTKAVLHGSALLVLALALSSTGCGVGKVRQAAQRMQDSNDLKQIALAYHMYNDDRPGGLLDKSKGPASVDEFIAWSQQKDPEVALALASLKSGKYVFYLGVSISELAQSQGLSNTVLGYAATTPTAGGPVAMADGSVRNMTAAEFAAAMKPPNAKLSQP